ncbi:MAG: hypothetical protein AUI47_01590 [Acidobacteria bacterium 13_1_40CM_2_68_5]|nr:MAG: hypothetical protein AUI47_01590 [Acidobacteria bacterium 13_1_40CM_2_68_5]
MIGSPTGPSPIRDLVNPQPEPFKRSPRPGSKRDQRKRVVFLEDRRIDGSQAIGERRATPRAIETVTKIPAKSSNKQIADTRLPENMVGLPNDDCVSDEL